MNELLINNVPATRNEVHLLQAALRRACAARFNQGIDEKEIFAAIVAEAEKGTRDMHGLVRAAAKLHKAA